jgi:hypothetical protein
MASVGTFCETINFVGFAKTAQPPLARPVTHQNYMGRWSVSQIFAIPSIFLYRPPCRLVKQICGYKQFSAVFGVGASSTARFRHDHAVDDAPTDSSGQR